MNEFNLKASLTKGLIFVSGLAVLGLALVGSFYLMVAAVVVMLSMSAISYLGLKQQPVKVKSNHQPLDAEYRVVRRR